MSDGDKEYSYFVFEYVGLALMSQGVMNSVFVCPGRAIVNSGPILGAELENHRHFSKSSDFCFFVSCLNAHNPERKKAIGKLMIPKERGDCAAILVV